MPEDQVEEIKQKNDIVSIIGEHVDLKKAGRNYKANCPFHAEKTPSFMVSPELQIYKCFGCGESGDVISFLQKYEGMDFPEALKDLADRVGVKLKPAKGFRVSDEKEIIRRINESASLFYHFVLLRHQQGCIALDYLLKERGLSKKTIEEFRIGFAPPAPFALKRFLQEKKKFTLEDIRKSKIFFERNGRFYDRFRDRVIFPLFDHRGNTIGFSGRLLPKDNNKDLAKYINSPETSVYHKSQVLFGLNLTKGEIRRKKAAIVVEGELDLISTWQVGIRNVVALKGSAFTDEQARLLSRYAETLVMALDTDFAGDEAAIRGIRIAENSGMEVKVAKLGKFKDPDEAAKADPDKFKKLLAKPVGVWDFIIDSYFGRHDTETSTGKRAISKHLIPLISNIPDNIVRAHYMSIVAGRLNVPLEAVVAQAGEARIGKKVEGDHKVSNEPPEKTKGRRMMLEESLLKLVLNNIPMTLSKDEDKELIKSPLYGKLYRFLVEYINDNRAFDPNKFGSILPKELFSGYAGLVLSEDDREEKPPITDWKNELDIIRNELRIINVKEELDRITGEMRVLEVEGKMKKLKIKEKEFVELTNELGKLKKN